MSTHDFLMISLSNEGEGASKWTYEQLSRSVGSLAKVQQIHVPDLLVGTLDSLMTCSEDLQKADNQLRQICSAVARTHDEVARVLGKEAKVGPVMWFIPALSYNLSHLFVVFLTF